VQAMPSRARKHTDPKNLTDMLVVSQICLQAMLFLFAFAGAFGGYAAGRLFRMFRGTRWKANGELPLTPHPPTHPPTHPRSRLRRAPSTAQRTSVER
jgi:hypothetical protein